MGGARGIISLRAGFPAVRYIRLAFAVFRSAVRGLPPVASAAALHIGTRRGGCRYHRGRIQNFINMARPAAKSL